MEERRREGKNGEGEGRKTIQRKERRNGKGKREEEKKIKEGEKDG